uniref:Zn-finger, RING domain containing protein n=1 Tax=Toxoplasma gondii COUG TaxID=1074873 RepID=A0A2G8XRF1_TOXGO|nr:Zn-finger, RING domain containing protein [Toxoplasma gondii COUG]
MRLYLSVLSLSSFAAPAQECIEKYVLNKKGGFYGDKVITKQDIIPLVPGGTGYSSHNTVEGVVCLTIFTSERLRQDAPLVSSGGPRAAACLCQSL